MLLLVRANGDQSQVKGPTQVTDLFKAGQTGKSANSGDVQSSSMFLVELGTERYPVSPSKQTDLPPEDTAQEAQRVVDLSKGVRAEVCWQGRQDMRAVILLSVSFEGLGKMTTRPKR